MQVAKSLYCTNPHSVAPVDCRRNWYLGPARRQAALSKSPLGEIAPIRGFGLAEGLCYSCTCDHGQPYIHTLLSAEKV